MFFLRGLMRCVVWFGWLLARYVCLRVLYDSACRVEASKCSQADGYSTSTKHKQLASGTHVTVNVVLAETAHQRD